MDSLPREAQVTAPRSGCNSYIESSSHSAARLFAKDTMNRNSSRSLQASSTLLATGEIVTGTVDIAALDHLSGSVCVEIGSLQFLINGLPLCSVMIRIF